MSVQGGGMHFCPEPATEEEATVGRGREQSRCYETAVCSSNTKI